ncbi:MAG: MFS transporter [Coriobacteriia bacterium]|nr:MFS transporter [Coriobacteriia bacterium]
MPDRSDNNDTSEQPTSAECDTDSEFQELCEVETEVADAAAPPQKVVRSGGTFESFRNPDFAWFWSGALVSNVGTWMQNYALGIVVYSLRSSSFDLGAINFIVGIPVLFLAIPGGLLADRVDRRKLLIWIQVVLLFQASALGYLYMNGTLRGGTNVITALAWLAGLGIVAGIFSAIQFPAWQAMMPDLVPRESLLNGIALNSAQFQSSRLIGPLAAGALVVAGFGMGDIFYVNAASFLFVIASLAIIRPRFAVPAEERAAGRPREGAVKTLLGGLEYARQNKVIGVLILSTAVMTIFGFPYMTLLPAIINQTLGFAINTDGYNRAVAIVMATNGLGAMAGALSVASLPATVRRNRIIPFALLAFGVSLLAFSLTRSLWLMAIVSAFAGAALMTTNSLANTSIQSSTPPHLRGRVMGLFVTAFMGIMPISGLAFGTLGQFIGPSNAVLIGSVFLVGWSLYLIVSNPLTRGQAAPASA